ncbi:hypothetical protein VP01_660g3 [Puccinia sorghi]|uniref:RFX-type winged-helix domain-containing protein n=1 Tax=Puccinia sorghi TaxID=27349 RepID=A0A0L6UF89_9BASI|nr:hypothetical protein VP01_660g3 [Puccinia sorghi]
MASQPTRTRPNRRSTRTQQQQQTPTPATATSKITNIQTPLDKTAIETPSLTPNSYQHHITHISPTKQPPPLTGFQRLSLLLDGKPHYLDQPGPQNRILLSIKSTLSQDTDYGLEVLLAGSFFEPDLIPLSRFPGLIDSLLDLIDLYRSPGVFYDPIQKATRRRALEATLVVRNLLCLDSNASSISSNHPRLLPLIIQGFRHAQSDSDHEFVTLLLEILETLASHNLVRLDQPVLSPAIPRQNIHHQVLHSTQPSETSPDKQTCRDWPSELVRQLDRLTHSSDRALVLAAYRCFTAIGSLAANQVVLTAELFRSDPARSKPSPWPKAIERALVLLALPDVEMLLVVLDYLYTLTLVNTVALSICYLHPDILAIFKLLLVHVHHNCRLERFPVELLPIPEPKWYFQRPPVPEPIPEEVALSVYGNSRDKAPLVTGARTTPQTLTMSEVHQILLPESQLKDLINLSEPNRARQWMSRVFEPFPGGEVQQVTLWLAYKTQFENFQTPSQFGPGIQMIAPAEAIKLTSDVFPNALPSVTEHKSGEKKFVIAGMRVRPKKHAKIWKCNWKECAKNASEEESDDIGTGGPERLYRHVEKAHIAPRTSKCHWLGCTYQAGNRMELLLHVRTHILYLPSPAGRSTGRGEQGTKGEKTETTEECLPFRSFIPERWETPNTGPYLPDQPLSAGGGGGAVGIGFVAVLVLRNLISAVADALVELVKTLEHQGGLAQMVGISEEIADGSVEEQGWRMVDVLQDPHSTTTTEPVGPVGLSPAQAKLVRLARLLSGTHPSSSPSSSSDHADFLLISATRLPTGFIEKEARTLLSDGPHFLPLAADLLHLITSIASNLHSIHFPNPLTPSANASP